MIFRFAMLFASWWQSLKVNWIKSSINIGYVVLKHDRWMRDH